MNPLNRQWFYRDFHRKLTDSLGKAVAAQIWCDAGKEYSRILASQPELKRNKGAMTLPADWACRASDFVDCSLSKPFNDLKKERETKQEAEVRYDNQSKHDEFRDNGNRMPKDGRQLPRF